MIEGKAKRASAALLLARFQGAIAFFCGGRLIEARGFSGRLESERAGADAGAA